MIFSKDTLSVGGMIIVPDSFANKKDAGEIFEKTNMGINVVYHKGTARQQKIFYGYAWLNHMYGGDDTSGNDLNDKIPF